MTTNPETSIEESLQSNNFQAQPLEITISNSYAENQRILTPLSDFSEEFSETIVYPPEKINSASSSKSIFH